MLKNNESPVYIVKSPDTLGYMALVDGKCKARLYATKTGKTYGLYKLLKRPSETSAGGGKNRWEMTKFLGISVSEDETHQKLRTKIRHEADSLSRDQYGKIIRRIEELF